MKQSKQDVSVIVSVPRAEQAEVDVKVVAWARIEQDVKLLAEAPLKKGKAKLRLRADEAQQIQITAVPETAKTGLQVSRYADAQQAPTTTLSQAQLSTKKVELQLSPIDQFIPIWQLTRKVCGRVIKRDPVTGEACPVPGATVSVFDVDYNLFWHYPNPNAPWAWLYPFLLRRELLASVKADECGYFCLEVPLFDLDYILRWRLRYRCLWEILRVPTVLEAIELGVKPPLRRPDLLEKIPELEPRFEPPIPLPDPPPFAQFAGVEAAIAAERMMGGGKTAAFYSEARFAEAREQLQGQQRLFEPVADAGENLLNLPAFPNSVPAPSLPQPEILCQYLPEKLLAELPRIKPKARLLRCFLELVPEFHLFLDVPDIVFRVEQDVDADGDLEVIYDQGYFDVNWNLSEPTSNVVIEAWENAICIPDCDPTFEPCTTTGIVGIEELPVDPAYLSAAGYARRANRPNPASPNTGASLPLANLTANAETPFAGTFRLVGCPAYETAVYYKLFYSFEGNPETHFTEAWHIYNIAAGVTQQVQPDANGFYEVLTPANNFFPYHTLLNWRSNSGSYPNGQYQVRLALYDGSKNPIAASIDPVNIMIDNSRPTPLNFTQLQWRHVGEVGWQSVPLHCPIIKRDANRDIELRVRFDVAAAHLRNYTLSFSGCDGGVGSKGYWHEFVGDNVHFNETWTVTMPKEKDEGAYRFYLRALSRAYNGNGGLATDWYMNPAQIDNGRSLFVSILNQ